MLELSYFQAQGELASVSVSHDYLLTKIFHSVTERDHVRGVYSLG